MINNNNQNLDYRLIKPKNSGFVLLYAVLVTLVVVTVGVLIMNIITKQIILSSIGKNSQLSAYAAVAGLECAKYWGSNLSFGSVDFADLDHPNVASFSPPDSDTVAIHCQASDTISLPNDHNPSQFSGQWTIVFDWGGCANVDVKANVDGLHITSTGYNLGNTQQCPKSSPRLTQRVITTDVDLPQGGGQ